MLCITRKEKQAITLIFEGIEVEVYIQQLYDHNGVPWVKLSIDAPDEVKIIRNEIREKEENYGNK